MTRYDITRPLQQRELPLIKEKMGRMLKIGGFVVKITQNNA